MGDVKRPARLDAVSIERRRLQVGQLYLRRVPQAAIADRLQVSQATISADLKYLRQQWAEEQRGDVEEIILRELEELGAIEQAAAVQFAQTHEPAWLALRLKAKERRSKYLGLDAPERKDVTSGGVPFKVYLATAEDWTHDV